MDTPQEQTSQAPSADGHEEVFAPTANAASLALPRVSTTPGARRAEGTPGRTVRAVPDPQPTTLAVPDTLRAALTRTAVGGGGAVTLCREDFRAPVREETGGRRVLFVADASGSMGTRERMGAVKGAMLDLLREQTRRDRVALITFRATGATLDLGFTTDPHAAEAAITAAPTGGRTPLAHALTLAAEVLAGERGAQLVLFTDGRANVPMNPGGDAWADALNAAQALRGVPALIVDTEAGHVRLGRAAQLAEVMGAELTTLGAPA